MANEWPTFHTKRCSYGVIMIASFLWSVGKQVKNILPQAEWHIIPESGHLPQWEQPQVVNPLILSFLEKDL